MPETLGVEYALPWLRDKAKANNPVASLSKAVPLEGAGASMTAVKPEIIPSNLSGNKLLAQVFKRVLARWPQVSESNTSGIRVFASRPVYPLG